MNLIIDNVSKLYGSFVALNKINLTLEPGIYGLLGPNGAGKTTLIKILTNLLPSSTGRVLYDGKDISSLGEKYRDCLGYLPQDFGVYPNFTCHEFLHYIARLKGIDKASAEIKISQLLKLVTMEHKRNHKLKGFSGGERQRVGIVQCLLNDPAVLILDEPTTGLDPQERIHFRSILTTLCRHKIILLSTHIVSDIESIADNVILLKQGSILNMDSPQALLKVIEGKVWSVISSPENQEEYTTKYPCSNVSHFKENNILRLISDHRPQDNAQLLEPTLEDLFAFYFFSK